MWFCRQCEVVKDNAEQIDVAGTFDEGISAEDLIGKTSKAQDANCLKKQRMSPGEVTPSTSEGNQSARTEGSADDEKHQGKKERLQTNQSARSEASMDEETRKAEKERLHSMIKSFSREAVSGLKCKMVENSGGSCVTAKFSLDRALMGMIVEYRTQKLMVSLEDVEDVYSYDDVVHEMPDSQVGQRITKEDRSKAIFVHHRAKDLPEPWICLLLSKEAEVEQFTASLKILRLRAVSVLHSARAKSKGTSLAAV